MTESQYVVVQGFLDESFQLGSGLRRKLRPVCRFDHLVAPAYRHCATLQRLAERLEGPMSDEALLSNLPQKRVSSVSVHQRALRDQRFLTSYPGLKWEAYCGRMDWTEV